MLVIMASFCAVIRRDSVSLLKVLFASPVHVFWWAISPDFVSNIHRSFSAHLCFLVFVVHLPVLFLAAVTSLSLLFLI